jgi:hypothetical protein
MLDKTKRLEKVYTLQGITIGSKRALIVVVDSKTYLVYRRLEHLSSESLQYIQNVTIELLDSVKTLKEPCELCILTKIVRVVNRESSEQVIVSLVHLHTDF